MELGFLEYYLIVINIVGFIAFAINTWLYSYTVDAQIDVILTGVSIMGGSLGIIVSMLVFDRKVEKGNMMSRVFGACIFVIQIIVVLILKGYIASDITFAFWNFFSQHKILIAYFVIINFIALAVFAIDKIAAIERKSRIRIVTLLSIAFAGGSIGALVAMYLFRHKTLTDYFTVGIPLIMVMQSVVIFYMMNMA